MADIKIGIIVADIDEYLPFVEEISYIGIKPYKYFNKKAVAFNLYESEVICVNCGLGKVNAATAATHLVDMGCTYILNFGLSGGISGVKMGEIVIPDTFLEHDFDLTSIGYKHCEKPGQKYIYNADKKLLEKASRVLENSVSGTAVCGDRFICSEADRDFLFNTFGATSCDMETAAIASVCDMAQIPFMCIRRISDDAGENAYTTYREINTNDGLSLARIFLTVLNVIAKG